MSSETIQMKDNQEVVFRYPVMDDAQALLALIQNSVFSSDYLLLTPFEVDLTLEQEKAWLRSVLEDANKIMLVATIGGIVVGSAELTIGSMYKRMHWAVLGITVRDTNRGLGLGELLLRQIIEEAKKRNEVEYINLEVFADNLPAVGLYKKVGFKENGRFENAYRQPDGTYCDGIHMSLKIK